MHRFIIISILLFAAKAFSQTNADSMSTIRGRIWYSESYCMGTPPDKIDEGHPYANIKLYVIRKKEGTLLGEIVQQFISDSEGNFEFIIPKGNYTIQRHPYPEYLSKHHEIEWTQGSEYPLTVNSLEQQLFLSFYKPCPDGPERM